MRDVLLVLVLVLIAVLGEILVKHIEAFMDKNYKGYTPSDPEIRDYLRQEGRAVNYK